MTDGRKRSPAFSRPCASPLSAAPMLVAAPTYADPDIDTVQSRVDKLYQQAEQASERYNDARLEMKQAPDAPQRAAGRPRPPADQGRRACATQVAAAVVVAVPGPGALLDDARCCCRSDPDAFLDQLTTVSEYNDQQSQMMADFAVQAEAARDAPGRRQARARPDRRDQEGARQGEGRDRLQGRRGQGPARHAQGPRRRPASRSNDRAAPRPPPPRSSQRRRLRPRRCRGPLRHGPGRGRLRLRRRRSERLRLLRPHDDGLGAGRGQSPALLERADGLRHRPSRSPSCSPATWCSTTARSATWACTSATA